MTKLLIRAFMLAGTAYLGLCTAVYLLQDNLLFFPRPNNQTAASTLAPQAWQTSNGVNQLTGWMLPAPQPQFAPLVIYFGGNGQDVAEVASQRLHVANTLYMNYRGYGSSSGNPSEAALFADAVHVYDTAIRTFPFNGRVILHGRSLGTGVAVHLAAERQVDGLILVTPYDSIAAVAQSRYGLLPVDLLLKHRFDSLRRTARVNAPAFILIAGQDRIVPPQHAENLAAKWQGPVEVMRIAAANHLNATASAAAMSRINTFILSKGKPAES